MMMRSLNTQDIAGAQPKKVSNNRIRYNGNTSSINLATGEQIVNGTSLPSSPPKDKNNAIQIQQPNSYNKQKNVYHQVDSVKGLFQNDENDQMMKEIKKVNLTITPFANKVSNNININGGIYTTTNSNNNSMNMGQFFKQNNDGFKKESIENMKQSLPTVNESAPRMRSDNDFNQQREQRKNIEIKMSEQFPSPDNNTALDNNNNNNNINNYNSNNSNYNNNNSINNINNQNNLNQMKLNQEQGRRYSSKNILQPQTDKNLQSLTLSVKYPVQQGVINLFELKKDEDEKQMSKSMIQNSKSNNQLFNSNNDQRQSLLMSNHSTNSDKPINLQMSPQMASSNLPQYNVDINKKEIHLFQNKPIEQIQIKSSPEFYQLKGLPVKNNVVHVHHMFNSYRPSPQFESKGFSAQMQQVQNNQNQIPSLPQILDEEQDEKSPGGGFYGEPSPQSPQPVQMPTFDMKALGEGKQSQKDLLQNKKGYQVQRKIQTPVQQVNGQTKKIENNNSKEVKKCIMKSSNQLSKEQRIVVVCESSNQTREWVNRFLGMRNISEYESFTLPGGPGCFTLEDKEERDCWQSTFKQFIKNLYRIYQIQEIQIYQNSNSIYSTIFPSQEQNTGRTNQQAILQENLRQSCQFIKDSFQLPVKGFSINSKGIIEKTI